MGKKGNPANGNLNPVSAALFWSFASFVGLLFGSAFSDYFFPGGKFIGQGRIDFFYLCGFLTLLGVPLAAFQCILLFHFFKGEAKHRWRIWLWFPITILGTAIMILLFLLPFWLPIEPAHLFAFFPIWILLMLIGGLTASVGMGAAQWYFVIRAFGLRSGWIGFTLFGALISFIFVFIIPFFPYDRAFFYSLHELARSIHLPPDLSFISRYEYLLYVRSGKFGLALGTLQALYWATRLRCFRK